METAVTKVTAVAHPNIALIKYWGKTTGPGNLPATGSISIGLEALWTTTSMSFSDGLADSVRFDDVETEDEKAARIIGFLSVIRQIYGEETRLRVDTRNNFPTGAGLASSASGFAALSLAADRLLGLGLSREALAGLARQGSGSAARSIYGGFVEMTAGEDSTARPLAASETWPLEVVIAITSEAEKETGSTAAMQLTRETSPYFASWVTTHAADMKAARDAIAGRDFEQLADVCESNCLKMHATIMTSRPPLVYWNGVTLDVLHTVRQLRKAGVPAFFTIDAGPQVKVVCETDYTGTVEAALRGIPGVQRSVTSRIGGEPGVTAHQPPPDESPAADELPFRED